MNTTSAVNTTSRPLVARLLRHARTAALVAALVPAAQLAVAPTPVLASCDPADTTCPVEVPEPATLVLLLPAAALLLKARR